LQVLADFNPESASQYGLAGYDDKAIDLKAGVERRRRAALTTAREDLQKKLTAETDPRVRQDLQIMIRAADLNIGDSRINEQYLLPYIDVGQTVFQGEFALLQDQVAAARRPSARQRLQCYVGMGGCTPVTKEAGALFQAKLSDPQLLGPYKVEVEQNLANTARYVDGIRKLYARYRIERCGFVGSVRPRGTRPLHLPLAGPRNRLLLRLLAFAGTARTNADRTGPPLQPQAVQ
jgi:hypothetical protein